MIFSIAIGANYSFELNSIETEASTFFGHINLFLGSVYLLQPFANMLPTFKQQFIPIYADYGVAKKLYLSCH